MPADRHTIITHIYVHTIAYKHMYDYICVGIYKALTHNYAHFTHSKVYVIK